jgi:hypothetical protein
MRFSDIFIMMLLKLQCVNCKSPLSILIQDNGEKTLCCWNCTHEQMITHTDCNVIYKELMRLSDIDSVCFHGEKFD